MAGANCGPVADGCGGLLSCGTCAPGQTCGAVMPSVCGTPGGGTTTCTNLCLRRATCTGTATTTISGTVVTPALTAPDPLYNAVVYIPNAPVAPFAPGVSCDRCGSPTSGSPVVSAVTGADGRFVLRDVPVGANIPLVIQLGRWRRQITIRNVNPCVDNALPTSDTRLPRNRMEGDIPLMAMVTGNVDALECVLRKIGIADSEFTIPSAGGRVQFYVANGATMGRATPAATALYNDPATLSRYDMVLFACEGSENRKPAAAQRNLVNYANAGGRVFSDALQLHVARQHRTLVERGHVARRAAQPGQPPHGPHRHVVSARRGLRAVAPHRGRVDGHQPDLDHRPAPRRRRGGRAHRTLDLLDLARDGAAPHVQHARGRGALRRSAAACSSATST